MLLVLKTTFVFLSTNLISEVLEITPRRERSRVLMCRWISAPRLCYGKAPKTTLNAPEGEGEVRERTCAHAHTHARACTHTRARGVTRANLVLRTGSHAGSNLGMLGENVSGTGQGELSFTLETP